MNESSAYLWRNIQNKDFTAEDLVKLLIQEYEVDKSVAMEDVQELLKQWLTAEIVTE